MPGSEQEGQEAVELPETVPGAPEWGGVPRAGGDHADATGGAPIETDVTPDADADADEDAGAAPPDPQARADSPTNAGGGE